MKAQLPSRTAASASAALATTMRRFGWWGLSGVALFGGGRLLCRPRASASVLHGKRDVELARAIGNHPVGLHALFVIVAHAAPQVHRLERAPRKDGAAAAARVGASPPLVVPLRLPATIRARRAALHDRATRVVEKVAEEERFVGGPRVARQEPAHAAREDERVIIDECHPVDGAVDAEALLSPGKGGQKVVLRFERVHAVRQAELPRLVALTRPRPHLLAARPSVAASSQDGCDPACTGVL
mmetsp:Transcript_28889/g.95913  ORF Transcript_28889/g.95913 Transcript_28889/m.95913 type:complete len:242 (+) Transcript_28889:315-1040(+)